MADVEAGLRKQVENIEAQYGKPIADWIALVKKSGIEKHTEVVAMLKTKHGLAHGAAHRISLLARAEGASDSKASKASKNTSHTISRPAKSAPSDATQELYAGKKAALFPIHQKLMAAIEAFGSGLEVAPKKGYLSLRRKKQFAMIKPASQHVDVGLILPDAKPTARLELSGSFNALFTHRVRVPGVEKVDKELVKWLREAWERAG